MLNSLKSSLLKDKSRMITLIVYCFPHEGDFKYTDNVLSWLKNKIKQNYKSFTNPQEYLSHVDIKIILIVVCTIQLHNKKNKRNNH